MLEALRKLRGERLPDLAVPAALVAGDNSALRVDHEDVGLVRRPEPPRAVAIRVGDRRPAPAIPLDERAPFFWGVCDVETEKRQLRMTLLELGVGDRLALARASPRRPDVHEDLPTAKLGKGGLLAVEGRSRDRRRLRACSGLRSGLRGRGNRGCCVITRASSAARDDERTQGQEKREHAHGGRVAPTNRPTTAFRIS